MELVIKPNSDFIYQPSLASNQQGVDVAYAFNHEIPHVSTPPDDQSTSEREIESSSQDDSNWDVDFFSNAPSELPPGIDPDERLLNPSKYFVELEQLANEVYVHSALGTLGQDCLQFSPPRIENPTINFPYPKDRPRPELDDDAALESCGKLLAAFGGGTGSVEPIKACIEVFLELLECRNIICAVCDNFARLSQARFCTTYISFLALEMDRFVARLVRLPNNELKLFDDLFSDALNTRYNYILELIDKLREDSEDAEVYLEMRSKERYLKEENHLTHNCWAFLKRTLDLEPTQNLYGGEIWRGLIHMLDLAVLSYASAHLGDYPVRIPYNHIVSPFRSISRDLIYTQLHGTGPLKLDCQIRLSRKYRLRCLDPLLGQRPVWAFGTKSEAPDISKLYLSTDIKTFADIWGPLWRVDSQLEPPRINHYNVGGGTISRCPDPNDMMAPQLRAREVYAHWETTAERIFTGSQIPPGDDMSTQLYFQEDDILLIGASRNNLRSNPDCRCDLTQITKRLLEFRCLRPVGTSKSGRVQDADTVQAHIGATGVQVGYQRTYKLRAAQTWKQALVESWENSPERRNPWILQQRCGAEVSACTRNARRIRLIELLRTQTMRNFLKFYTWRAGDYQNSFNSALDSKDLSSLSRLILDEKDSEKRREYGSALSVCFKILSATGLDDNAELSLLWSPDPGSEYLATLLRSEHTWTGFLKDTVHSCTFAVLDNRCLVSTYSDGRVCRSFGEITGYSIFETNLIVNERIIPEGIRRRQTHKTWDVSKISAGHSFALGDQGKLVIMAPLSRSTLLTYWRPHRSELLHELKEKVNEVILGKEAGIYHREYNQTEPVDIRPIPVLVVSEQREPC